MYLRSIAMEWQPLKKVFKHIEIIGVLSFDKIEKQKFCTKQQ